MRRRSNLMVLLGIAFFVVGLAAVFLVTNDDDDGGGGSGDDTPVEVVVASRTIAAGAVGADLVEDRAVRVIELPQSQVLPDAARSLEQIAAARFLTGFAKDQQVSLSGLQPLTSNIEVPEGFEAVAVQLDFVAGVAGYVTPNDRINLYGVYRAAGDKPAPRAELLLTDVKILDVNLDIAARTSQATDSSGANPARSGGEPITLLLALRTEDVEKVVFQTEFEGLYATLIADAAGPSPDTPGQDTGTILSGAPTGSGGED